LRTISAGLVDHLALRTAAIDAALNEALAEGMAQVILLGAGLDARGYRLSTLAGSTLFEVDHPSTQEYKRSRCGDLTVRAGRLVYVAVDFAKESLTEELEKAGYRREIPSFWIWEGVTMYLPLEATRKTMEAVRDLSAPGSRLAVTYSERVQAPFPVKQVVEASFQRLGEPFLGETSAEEMGALLRASGFRVLRDDHSVDWEGRFGGSSLAAIAYRRERLAVAERASPT
jgi:methyltransferase (TIGR00027 family)